MLGLITVARDAYVQSLPSRIGTGAEGSHSGPPDGTDLALGVRLAMATQPKDAATRIFRWPAMATRRREAAPGGEPAQAGHSDSMCCLCGSSLSRKCW